MTEPKTPSQRFLQSDGTAEDYAAFFEEDPIGAAQYATGVAKATESHFEGLDELSKLLESSDLSVEALKENLAGVGRRLPTLFRFVEATEAKLRPRAEGLGWTSS